MFPLAVALVLAAEVVPDHVVLAAEAEVAAGAEAALVVEAEARAVAVAVAVTPKATPALAAVTSPSHLLARAHETSPSPSQLASLRINVTEMTNQIRKMIRLMICNWWTCELCEFQT